jgi:hypothetical protein
MLQPVTRFSLNLVEQRFRFIDKQLYKLDEIVKYVD